MLTLIETLSLAGDRAKQNDDACGVSNDCAWVIDGATDLHSPPLTSHASDAAWIAQFANVFIGANIAADGEDYLRDVVREASHAAAFAFEHEARAKPDERWMSPLASLLMVAEDADGVVGLDLGDCRFYALGDDGVAQEFGGPPLAADNETKLAAQAAQSAGQTPLLRHGDTLDMLRRMRAKQNGGGAGWTFCLYPQCADEARVWRAPLKRPAHILIATDGFSALCDRYGAYDAGGLVRAALDKGLQELGRELRAIEADDSGGARHPRWKRSDDATAVLLRLS